MIAFFHACTSSLERRHRACRATRRLVLPALSLLLLAGCAVPPAPIAGPDPADPAVPVKPVSWSSSIGKGASRPVDVQDWRNRNQGVTPEVKP
jgi:hypothetical protein